MLTFSIVLCGAILVSAAAGSAGQVDLTRNGMNGAGIGFSFRDSDSMQLAKKYVSSNLPKCSIGPLDSVYFYVYECSVPLTFVTDMADFVGGGFLFTSDKSITMITNVTQTSLLLANAWNMALEYSSAEACSVDFDVVQGSSGCSSISACNTQRQLTVGCGSMSCTGCVLENYFTDFDFDVATFVSDTAASTA